MKGLVLGGTEIPCKADVRNWTEHGLEVRDGHGARRRRSKIDLAVLHWTGAEGAPSRVFRTLERRELGVEFCIGRDGVVWQFADPLELDTFDAGWVNRRSLGIEIVNAGWRKTATALRRKNLDRCIYTDRIHGRKIDMADFLPPQTMAVVHLLDAVIDSGKTSIKRAIPRTDAGGLVKRRMSRKELSTFAGVIGHFHVSRRKIDPGTRIFGTLAACGY